LAAQDYRQLAEHGIRAARDGVRWHLVEASPGRYDWSAVLPLLRAAEATGTRVVWDLCHYGWPDHVDIWSPGFVDRFAAYAAAFARLHLEETGPAAPGLPGERDRVLRLGGRRARAHEPACHRPRRRTQAPTRPRRAGRDRGGAGRGPGHAGLRHRARDQRRAAPAC
jgi:hypothetical protein